MTSGKPISKELIQQIRERKLGDYQSKTKVNRRASPIPIGAELRGIKPRQE